MAGSIEAYDDEGNPIPVGDARWKEIFDKMVAQGIIVPDKDAPLCMGCPEKLEEITVKVVSDLVPGDLITEETFTWIPGLHQFNVAPSFFGFVEEGWAHFEACCAKCGTAVIDLEIVEQPHGLKFGEAARMAGNLGA